MYVRQYAEGYDPDFGVGRYTVSEPTFAGYGAPMLNQQKLMQPPLAYPRSYYSGYGLIGAPEDVERTIYGISIMVHPPGFHNTRQPATFCANREDIERISNAFETRAREAGWVITHREVHECEHGDPPGQYMTFEFEVPQATPYLDPQLTPGEEAVEPKKNTALIVGGIAAGLLAVGGIVYLVTR